MVLKPEPLRTATVASTDVVLHDIASQLQPNVSVTEEPTDETNRDTVEPQPSCSTAVEPEEVVENKIPQPKETQITRVESMNVSVFQTHLF
jgi:hypothetical protein